MHVNEDLVIHGIVEIHNLYVCNCIPVVGVIYTNIVGGGAKPLKKNDLVEGCVILGVS
jgi:hypothetical protein